MPEWGRFEGVQPLIMKGLLYSKTEAKSIRLLSTVLTIE